MRYIDLGMSNFDHSIDDGFAEALQAEPALIYGTHAAWNFHGRVWFADGQFHEEVWVYHEIRDRFSAATLEDLMKLVNDEYGWD
jgi:hypothetical protein